jgi:hypothetical protein
MLSLFAEMDTNPYPPMGWIGRKYDPHSISICRWLCLSPSLQDLHRPDIADHKPSTSRHSTSFVFHPSQSIAVVEHRRPAVAEVRHLRLQPVAPIVHRLCLCAVAVRAGHPALSFQISSERKQTQSWIPAFAGMTGGGHGACLDRCVVTGFGAGRRVGEAGKWVRMEGLRVSWSGWFICVPASLGVGS